MSGKFRLLAGVATAMLFSAQASATIVRVETNMGSFDVSLYDRGTPATVANFLAYVTAGRYTNTLVHRKVTGFVAQGGGYRYDGTSYIPVTQNAAVTNEPEYSNVRGTIAMAKFPGNPNSATSQWFINVGNNYVGSRENSLDTQNGGFTVFGQVIGTGMDVIDLMNAVPVYSTSISDSIPLRNYTPGQTVIDANLVIVTSVTVLDSAVDTIAGLTLVPNTLIDQVPDPDTGGGGATGLGSLLLLGALNLWRQRRITTR